MASNKQKLAVSILNFLKLSMKEDADNAESLQVAVECIRDVFGVDENDSTLQISTPLSQIFDKFIGENGTTTTSTTTTTTKLSKEELLQQAYNEIPDELLDTFKQFISIIEQKGAFANEDSCEEVIKATKQKFFESKSGEIKAIAEKLKNEGNARLNEGKHQEALTCYNKAILYDNTNAIYFANRAATHSALQNFEKSIEDCVEAIKRNPNYGKAYTRMGSAYTSLGKFPEAMEAYNKALELEPNNETFKASLANAERLAAASKQPATMPNIPGMPDLGGLDFGSLLSNPAIRGLANNLMSDPKMKEMMDNGDMASLLNNPELLKMFGNLGKK
ncbi:hypothetical protein RB653_005590 [Dictyostelium firmibasis]|uniref:SGTA homodimerisation domain-containing protein n=1 Tax=Dictyostelium firmibasis TaxID=79012 RepID=A0AAN7YT35_9MYCE